MNREEVCQYILEKYAISPSYLWERFPFYAAFKHQNNKWFGIVMNVKKENLGFKGTGEVDILVVKTNPSLIATLLEKPNFFPAYHMNKKNWITIMLNGKNANEIKEMIDFSFELTK